MAVASTPTNGWSSGSSNMRSSLTTARYAASPVGVALSSSPMTVFLQRTLTLHNVRADDKICVECLTRCERDAQPTCNDRVRLHIACSGAEADTCPQGHTGEMMERRVIACCAMDLVVRRAVDTQLTLCVCGNECTYPTLLQVSYRRKAITMSLTACTQKGLPSPERKKIASRDIYLHADFTHYACRFKKCDAVPNMNAYGLQRGPRCLHQVR